MEKTLGLTKNEVKTRYKQGLYNYEIANPSKSIKQILFENIFTLFNFINIILGVAIILVGSYKNLLFLGVVICNTLISSIQEIRAKKMVDKLSLISSSSVKVIRDGKRIEIGINDIVLDDTIIYELGNQVVVDSVILEGVCEVNESFITGESKTIYKKCGDTILSGSFIVSGNVICEVKHVGKDNYTSKISYGAKKTRKDVNSEIMRSLKKIVKYVSISLIPIGILLLLRQFSVPENTVSDSVTAVVAALIAMIPEGLILLVSTVLAISVLRLSKYNVLVQDLYAVETLSRVDTLCLDKTGTITEGVMEVKDVIPIKNHKINEIDNILNIITSNLNDNNPTFKALKDKYNEEIKTKALKKINFSSERKFSGVVLENERYILGAPEFVLKGSYKKYKEDIEKYTNENRVLVLIKTDKMDNDLVPKKKDLLALILITDKIRYDVVDTLEYFKKNDVEIKVISGDNPKTVSSIAKKVGIDIKGVCDASLIDDKTDMSFILKNNNIFGRVKPDQKYDLIKALRNDGHVVAMTGDGVNDVLALKEADCAIAMNDGSDAARNVSELVLLNSNFNAMPHIVKEGRRTINNVERSATLFLSKTIYASFLAVLFLFIKYTYPFVPIQMTLINALTIGIPAFILALEPNHNRVKPKFLLNVISKAIPSGITTVINILLLVLLASIFGLPTKETSTIAVIVTAYTAVLLIYRISKPLNFLRSSLLVIITLIFAIAVFTSYGKIIFSLAILSRKGYIILAFIMLLSTRLFNLFSRLLKKLVDKKPDWFK